MKTKYTGERWNNPEGSVSVFDGKGKERTKICDAAWVTIKVEDARANARLIAAAPELLEACKAIADCDTPSQDMGGDWGSVEWAEWVGQAIEKAKSAIRKAT